MEKGEKQQKSPKDLGNPSGFLFLIVAAAVNAATWASLYWKLPPSDEIFFLHYNIYFGVDSTGDWSGLLWIPASGAIYIVMNAVLLVLLRQQQPAFKRVIGVMTIVLNVIACIAMWLLINSNLS
jgi:hypothetical protein